MGVKYKSGILSAKYKNLEKTFKCVKISKEFQIINFVAFILTEYFSN